MCKSRALFFICAVQVGMVIVGCGSVSEPPVEVGGNYPPVTEKQLRQTEFSHRTGGEDFEFTWSFEDDRFVIEGNEIPSDLITAILGPDASTTRIEGTWQIHDGTIDFALDDDDDSGTAGKCSLPIYFTGVIRIETPKAQYVF